MSGAFTGPELEAMRTTGTVRIETRRAAAEPGRVTPIWIVVDAAGRVLVRSVRGRRGRWYRDLLAYPDGEVIAGATRIPIRAERAEDEDRIEACSRALEEKYPRAGASLASMLVPDVLETTLELHRA